MPRHPFLFNPNYLAVARGLQELHRFIQNGQDDSPEADAIRDATDAPWRSLSEAERNRLAGLSEDLYSISEPVATEPMNPQAQAKLNEAVEARENGDWDRALELLRRWGKHIPLALVSYLRGSIWLEAGDPETAAVFYGHASELEPESGNYFALFLHALDMTDPGAARRRAEEVLRDHGKYPPVVVARAADVLFKSFRTALNAEARNGFRRLIPILEQTLIRIEKGDEGGVDQSAYAMVVALLGFCYEFLGDFQHALDYYSRGLRANPYNDGLLTARGILLYGSSSRAINDFELAVRNGCPVVWPYFFLAHHYLISRRFEDCRQMCERAGQMEASDAVKSELADWLAISQAELGFPLELVRAAFDKAIQLNPANERARRNLSAFESAIRPAFPQGWDTQSEAALRAFGLAEWRYSLAA
jgi:tetratricopeptide (TPR) repeat protein